MTGRWGRGCGLIAVGLLTATFVDNILYARLAGGRMRMHTGAGAGRLPGRSGGVRGLGDGPGPGRVWPSPTALLEVWKRRLAASAETSSLAASSGSDFRVESLPKESI